MHPIFLCKWGVVFFTFLSNYCSEINIFNFTSVPYAR